MDATTYALGHDPWTRDLDDNAPAYALCVPQAVFDDDSLKSQLLGWLRTIFAQHSIGFTKATEWRASSADPVWCESSLYLVDWYGSRCRRIDIGPHLYVVFEKLKPKASGGSKDPMPTLPLWHTSEKSHASDYIYYTVEVAATPEDLNLMVRKEQIRNTVLSDAVNAAWNRWRNKKIPVAANHDEYESPYVAEYEWTQVGGTPHKPVEGSDQWTEAIEAETL